MGDRSCSMVGAWVAANVALSAVLYLFDFATNILALRTYYFLDYTCNTDPDLDPAACDEASGAVYGGTFKVSLSLMLLAHACNSVIFWRSLDPGQHPLRLAYFLPLIHLFRLLRLLFWRASSRFDYSRIPKKLILSLVASTTSITYNGGMSCMLNMPEFVSLRRKASIGVTAGVHTLAVVASKCLIVAAFVGNNKFILLAYVPLCVVANWAHYSGQSLMSKSSTSMSGRSGWIMSHMHTLATAYVSFLLGPLYVVTKHFPGPNHSHCPLVFSTLLHILLDLIGLALVLLVSAFVETWFPTFAWGSPCPGLGYPFYKIGGPYMPCTLLPWLVFSALLLIFLTTLIFAMVEKGAKPLNDHIEIMPSRFSHEHILREIDQG